MQPKHQPPHYEQYFQLNRLHTHQQQSTVQLQAASRFSETSAAVDQCSSSCLRSLQHTQMTSCVLPQSWHDRLPFPLLQRPESSTAALLILLAIVLQTQRDGNHSTGTK
jgi:hypothetical protein